MDKKQQPDLSYSTLEPIRGQLNSIIADAAHQMNMQDELEKSIDSQFKNINATDAINTATSNLVMTNGVNGNYNEILTLNGSVMNGVILTMNPNKNVLNTTHNTTPLNLITSGANKVNILVKDFCRAPQR